MNDINTILLGLGYAFLILAIGLMLLSCLCNKGDDKFSKCMRDCRQSRLYFPITLLTISFSIFGAFLVLKFVPKLYHNQNG